MRTILLAISAAACLSSAAHAQSFDRTARSIDYIYESGARTSTAATAARAIGVSGFGRHYAVVVGVSRFNDSSLNELPGADDDALRMYDYLTGEAGFDRVWLITNEEASRDRIAQIVQDELSPKVTSSDRVLFYYTGHGVMKDHGGRRLGYLPLSYSSVRSPSTMISMQALKQWADSLFGARQVLFILDSCVSGLAGDVMMNEIAPMLRRSFSERGHHLISAGTGDQEGYATANGSYFTQALIDGLRGQADLIVGGRRDNAITVSELVVYLRDRLRRELLLGKGERYAMTPQMTVLNNARLGEFFFTTPNIVKEKEINGEIIPTGTNSAELFSDQENHQIYNNPRNSSRYSLLEKIFGKRYADSYILPSMRPEIDEIIQDAFNNNSSYESSDITLPHRKAVHSLNIIGDEYYNSNGGDFVCRKYDVQIYGIDVNDGLARTLPIVDSACRLRDEKTWYPYDMPIRQGFNAGDPSELNTVLQRTSNIMPEEATINEEVFSFIAPDTPSSIQITVEPNSFPDEITSRTFKELNQTTTPQPIGDSDQATTTHITRMVPVDGGAVLDLTGNRIPDADGVSLDGFAMSDTIILRDSNGEPIKAIVSKGKVYDGPPPPRPGGRYSPSFIERIFQAD